MGKKNDIAQKGKNSKISITGEKKEKSSCERNYKKKCDNFV